MVNELKPCPRSVMTTDDDGFPVDCGYPKCNCADATRLSELEAEVARLRSALEPFARIADGEAWNRFTADSQMTLRISNGTGSRHFCFVNAECFENARAALRSQL